MHTALFTPGRHGWSNILLWTGKPGGGKTAIAGEVAYESGMYPFYLIGATIEAPDIGGWPHPGELHGKKCLDFLSPQWVIEANHLCETTDCGVVIIADEINTSSPQVQGALLRVLNERVVGTVKLHDRVRFMCFMNPADIAIEAGGNPIAPALANRVGHLEWVEPNVREFCDYMLRVASGWRVTMGQPSKFLENAMMGVWNEFFVQASGDAAAFLSANAKRLSDHPKDADKLRQAYATCRTWEDAIRALAAARYHRLEAGDTWAYTGSFISEPIATEWRAYLQTKEIPDAADWLAGRITLDLKPTRADVASAVLRTAVALLAATKEDDSFVERCVFMIKWFTANNVGYSDLVSGPMREMFTVWRERLRTNIELRDSMAKKHAKVIKEFRAIPAMARLEDLGVLAEGTATR